MRHRALPIALRSFFFVASLGLAAVCWLAASATGAGDGQYPLSRYLPDCYRGDYFRSMAERHPQDEAYWLQRLLSVEPSDSETMLRLATLAEWRGDLSQADALFRQVSARDGRYRAQWARLGFEARHPDLAGVHIWETARRCFAMSHGDRRALLEAVWQLRPDGSFLLDCVIPEVPAVLLPTTIFLMEQGDLPSARRSFSRLIDLPYVSESRTNAGAIATALERKHLGLDLADLHLDRNDPDSALQIWRMLAVRQLTEVDGGGDAGRQVVNPCFRTEPLGRGFDWRIAGSSDVEMRRVPEGWRIEFAARPADRITLLHQRVLVAPDSPPVVEIQATGAPWLRAILIDDATGLEIAKPGARPVSAKPRPKLIAARLRLDYFRPPGQPAPREPLLIRQVQWRPAGWGARP